MGDGSNCQPAPAPVAELTAPAWFAAEFLTSAGTFSIEARREWAPRGADRLYSLLRANYFNDSRIYRVVAG